jgi:hypothetical protein
LFTQSIKKTISTIWDYFCSCRQKSPFGTIWDIFVPRAATLLPNTKIYIDLDHPWIGPDGISTIWDYFCHVDRASKSPFGKIWDCSQSIKKPFGTIWIFLFPEHQPYSLTLKFILIWTILGSRWIWTILGVGPDGVQCNRVKVSRSPLWYHVATFANICGVKVIPSFHLDLGSYSFCTVNNIYKPFIT